MGGAILLSNQDIIAPPLFIFKKTQGLAQPTVRALFLILYTGIRIKWNYF